MMVDGLRLHVLRTLDAYARRYFKSAELRKIIEYNIVFLGCAPHKSPALYSLMSHVDMTQGVRYPIGGISRLPEAIHSLAVEQGVSFRFNCGVNRIVIEKGRARGVETGQGFIEADIILSAAEYHHTETDLLDKKWRSYSRRFWEKRTLAPGAFIICLGLGKKVKGISHHNLFLTPEWDRHFAAIFDSPAWPDNPSYYVGCPSATDPGAAPQDCESLFFLVPVAPGLDDNEAQRRSYAYTVLRHFEQLTGERFLDSVRVMKILSHSDFINNGNYFKGTALGLAHTLWQTASFRPGHKSKKVKNLYFSGHYTHPGIGMPMVIISSHVISQRIEKEMRNE
jgi:phytoene desaturase